MCGLIMFLLLNRLWSTWDLSFVSEIPIIHFDGAVIA